MSPAHGQRHICHRRRGHALDYGVVVDRGRTGQPPGKAAHNPCASADLPGVLRACFYCLIFSVLRVVRPQRAYTSVSCLFWMDLVRAAARVLEALAALQSSLVCTVTLFSTALSSGAQQVLVTVHRRERLQATLDLEMQSLEQEGEHTQQRMAELCASLLEELEADAQHSAASIHSQSEEEESARRQERIKQLQAQISDIIFEACDAVLEARRELQSWVL